MKTIYQKLLFLVLLLPFSVFAQGTLEGVVTDTKTKQPLPGVNVVVQGTKTGVSTDFDGKFKLTKLKKGDKLVFSSIGYKSQTIDFNNQSSITVSLEEESNLLQEVVVQVGYGSVKKKDATGAVTTVTSKDFVKGPVVAVDQMIQGKVAGLQITNGGGAPGEGATIRIRSGASLNANNDPLFVIDGVPVAAENQGGRNPLATINQNDIESVTVLKDASATAIYGSRASNGVIIITTKRGKSGDLKVSYNGNVSFSEVTKTTDVLNTAQFRQYINTNGSAAQIALLGAADTNWQDEIYRNALGTDHNIALSGGTDQITYRASVGLTDMNGILERDNMNRATTGLSLIGNFFNKHLKFEFNNKTSSMKNNYSNKGAIGAAVSFDPTQSVYDENGDFFQWNNQLSGRNPVSLIEQFNNFGSNFRSIGNLQTEYKLHFLPALKLVANFGYDYTSGRTYGTVSPDFAYDVDDEYEISKGSKNRLMDLYFNYKKDIKAVKGSFELTAGYNYQNFNYFGNEFAVNNDIETIKPSYNTVLNLQSFFGRAIVNISDKYILTATYRRDGSSRFAKDNRWGNFPSAALAWKLSEESLFKNISSISTLKLRMGWGITGQQDIGTNVYPSLPTYMYSDNQAQYQFGNSFYNTVRPQQYNSNLKWEETETRNVGLDFGFLNNRINGSVEVYEKRTKDLLAKINLPPFYGFSDEDNFNIGKMKNQGIEITAEVVPVKNDNVNFTIGGNITLQNSEITEIIGDNPQYGLVAGDVIQGGVGNKVQQHAVGYAPNSFYVFEQAYDVAGQPIDGVFVDRNGDGTITTDDKYFFRKPNADVFYGFYTNFSYRNWDMSMSWRGSWGNYVYNNVDSNLGWSNQLLIRQTDLSNGVTEVLNTNFSSTDSNRYFSDYYIQKASFLRMDNITLGYNFKKFMGSDVNAKISLGGQNLLLITDYKGIDPEINGGIDGNIYPRPRMFTLGLNLNF